MATTIFSPQTDHTPFSVIVDLTIANGASLSGIVDFGEMRPVGFFMPAAWTAAGATFVTSPDGTTAYDMYDETGTEMSITSVVAGKYYALPFARTLGVRYLAIRSGTSGAAVNQGAARTLRVVAER